MGASGTTWLRECRCPGGLKHDTTRADLVRRCFDLFDSGKAKVDVLSTVTELGLRTIAGGELSAQSLDNILRNHVYAGVIYIPKWNLAVDGKFDPLIDSGLFGRVQDRLNGERVSATKSDVALHFRFASSSNALAVSGVSPGAFQRVDTEGNILLLLPNEGLSRRGIQAPRLGDPILAVARFNEAASRAYTTDPRVGEDRVAKKKGCSEDVVAKARKLSASFSCGKKGSSGRGSRNESTRMSTRGKWGRLEPTWNALVF